MSSSATRSVLVITLATVVALAAGCMSGHHRPMKTPQPPPPQAGSRHSIESAPAAAPSLSDDTADQAPARRSASPQEESLAKRERPGLGTGWGESRTSHVRHVSFVRANSSAPTSALGVYYNNRSGVRAMTRYGDYRQMSRAVFPVEQLVDLSIRDGHGTPLPAVFANGTFYAIGETGQRYTIHVRNRTGLRLEIVASVDGLDVLDGKAASPGKRGYLVRPHDSLEIAGWRQSDRSVAAFRFSSVKNSYAGRTGSARNVGVIGLAVFHERGTDPRAGWTDEELRRRRSADPFPGRYAAPPPQKLVY